MGEFSFGREYRIRRQKDIDRVFARRCSVADDVIIVYGCENGQDVPRLAVVASRKLGKSVVRNRWKRLIREVFRLNKHRIPAGVDYVVIPKRGATPDFHTLFRTFPHLVKQLKRRLERSAKREDDRPQSAVFRSQSSESGADVLDPPDKANQQPTFRPKGDTASDLQDGTTARLEGLSDEETARGPGHLGKVGRFIRRRLGVIDTVLGELLILPVFVYRWTISPLLGRCCRFEPSCSQYFILAVRKYGVVVGFLKGLARILRCHPWHPGGYDPP